MIVPPMTDVTELDAPATAPEPSEPSPTAVGTIPAGGGTTQPSRPLIFVSYRVDPDEAVALAMRRLIENSIEPSPEVYIATAGGLRPSEIGYKPQLQDAVARAKAFVGLITQASREREWIFYEAGAAWGRGKLYAPVLLDTTPSDLPSSIADYQATRADKPDDVQRLITALAKAVGGEPKSYFGQRYRAFEKAIGKDEPEGNGADKNPVTAAFILLLEGKTKEGTEAFEALVQKAKSLEEQADLRITQLVAGKETGLDLLAKLDGLEASIKTTPVYLAWRGHLEPAPLAAIANFEAALRAATSGTTPHRMATVGLAQRYVDIGRHDAALQVLRSAVRSTDRPLRHEAIEKWLEWFPGLQATSKLLLFSIGVSMQQKSGLLHERTNLAIDEGWHSLAVCFGRINDERLKSSSSANQLGRAYQTAKLPSLAYRAYRRAEKAGATVAKFNMASLLRYHAIAAAGAEILDSHSGPADSTSESYPHHVRAGIEEAVEAETKSEKQIHDCGSQIALQLMLLGELALMDESERDLEDGVRNELAERFQQAGGSKELAELIEGASTRVEFSRTLPGFNVWTATSSGGPVGFVHCGTDGSYTGFRAALMAPEATVTPIVKRAPAPGAERSV